MAKCTKHDNDDAYSTAYVENLLGGVNEWRNIQDIVRTTIKALSEVVRSQGQTIKELEKQISNKASKSELNSGLNIKANVADVMRTCSELSTSIESRPTQEEIQSYLDEKISKTDLNYFLANKTSVDEVRHIVESKMNNAELLDEIDNLNCKIEDVHKDFTKRTSMFITNKEMHALNEIIDTKANINDINEALNLKANKEQFTNFLHRKANKSDVEIAFKNKVDQLDFQNLVLLINQKLDSTELDRVASMIETKADKYEMNNILSSVSLKAEKNELENVIMVIKEFKRESNLRLEDYDQVLDKLIENIRKEFQTVNAHLDTIDIKKVDFKDFDKLSVSNGKKIEAEYMNSTIVQFKSDIHESLDKFKHEVVQNRRFAEEKGQEKAVHLEKAMERGNDEFNKFKESINDIYLKRESDQQETLSLAKQYMNTNNKELLIESNQIKGDLQRLYNDVMDMMSTKCDKKEIEAMKIKICADLEKKTDYANLENLYKNIQKDNLDTQNDNRQTINQTLKNFENDIHRALDKKANLSEVTTLLSNKADQGITNIALQSKISVHDVDNLKATIDNMKRDMNYKLDTVKFESMASDTFNALEEVQKDLMAKSNIKEVISLLKNKTDIEDVNKALTQIHEELDTKCNSELFNNAMDNQTVINDALCSENCVARWNWRSGQLKNGYAVPWEVQSVNTAPDNFLWEKEKASVLVVTAGLYEINLGFYAEKKPTVQLLVNGEPILSAVNSASYVIHHTSGRLKNVGKHSGGNITGLTLVDFINLQEKSRISVSFSGEDTGEGFLSLRKI